MSMLSYLLIFILLTKNMFFKHVNMQHFTHTQNSRFMYSMYYHLRI